MSRILFILLIILPSIIFGLEEQEDSGLQDLENMVLELEQEQETIANKDLYHIEILCFEHKKNLESSENFDNDIDRLDFGYAKEIIGDVDPEILQLNQVKRELSAKSSTYRVLLHTAWKQILNLETRSYAMLIEGKDLKGTIRVKTVRDLQVIADLVFNKNGKNYRMQQTWHLDRNKTYYFDHPKFGFFIRVYK